MAPPAALLVLAGGCFGSGPRSSPAPGHPTATEATVSGPSSPSVTPQKLSLKQLAGQRIVYAYAGRDPGGRGGRCDPLRPQHREPQPNPLGYQAASAGRTREPGPRPVADPHRPGGRRGQASPGGAKPV